MKMEKCIKNGNKWIFVGWSNILTEVWAIDTKETSKFIYILNKYKDGSLEEVRYRKNKESINE